MAAVHRAGIVHRDLKPDNLYLIQREHQPNFLKVIDFGIAKPTEQGDRTTLTQGALGTPAYMSPEQCLNEKADNRDFHCKESPAALAHRNA